MVKNPMSYSILHLTTNFIPWVFMANSIHFKYKKATFARSFGFPSAVNEVSYTCLPAVPLVTGY